MVTKLSSGRADICQAAFGLGNPGGRQTVPRAELFGATQALRAASTVHVDASYVASGSAALGSDLGGRVECVSLLMPPDEIGHDGA